MISTAFLLGRADWWTSSKVAFHTNTFHCYFNCSHVWRSRFLGHWRKRYSFPCLCNSTGSHLLIYIHFTFHWNAIRHRESQWGRRLSLQLSSLDAVRSLTVLGSVETRTITNSDIRLSNTCLLGTKWKESHLKKEGTTWTCLMRNVHVLLQNVFEWTRPSISRSICRDSFLWRFL